MKVLFVTSGNSKFHNQMPAFIKSQAESLIDAGVELYFFQIKGKGVRGYLKNILPLRNFLKTNNIDIIHAHFGFCGIVSSLARRKEKLIVSFMAESEFVPDPQHKNNPLTHVMPYLHKLFAKFGFDFLIFKSSNLAGFLPHLKYKSAIVPNGVNTDIFKPMNKIEARKKLNITSDLKIVLWIGDTTREVKGFHIATDVINLVKSKGIDLNFLYINKIPNEILPLYYNAADVFFLSSLSEGSPNVIKEAMACNCPIVTTLVGDVEYIIGNTKGCYIASDYDIESIAQLIINGLENVNRTNGSDRIDELKLDVKNIASKLISIYNKV